MAFFVSVFFSLLNVEILFIFLREPQMFVSWVHFDPNFLFFQKIKTCIFRANSYIVIRHEPERMNEQGKEWTNKGRNERTLIWKERTHNENLIIFNDDCFSSVPEWVIQGFAVREPGKRQGVQDCSGRSDSKYLREDEGQ